MRLTYYVSTGKSREEALAAALVEGLARHGDECEVVPGSSYQGPRPATDVAAVCGLKGVSRRCIDEHRRAGKQFLLFDKGYFRVKTRIGGKPATTHVRVSANDFQPLAYFERVRRSTNRWERFGLGVRDRCAGAGADYVVFAGSSQKYCDFHGLGDATAYAKDVVAQVRGLTNRPVIYRPKPSWTEAVPLPGTRFSRPPERLLDLFAEGCAALVTHGSNAALDALVQGVPVVVLGDAIARPLGADLSDLARAELPLPPVERRAAWCANVAYCQWSYDEVASGEMWEYLREELR